jgi:large subunit ribosomal protein L19
MNKITLYEKTFTKAEGELPTIRPGDTVRVHINIYATQAGVVTGKKKIHRIAAKGKEAKAEKFERVQIFEGSVIGMSGEGLRKKITVRKLSSGIGIEKVFFIHSPQIAKIDVVRHGKVRRAKLYFLRKRVGKAVRLTEEREAQA